jgi:hypothetical protein
MTAWAHRSRDCDWRAASEGRLKPPTSCLAGSVQVLPEDFHGPAGRAGGTLGDLGRFPRGVLSVL